jgi:predicted aldo/keto reductase-like oxidoreductase
LFGAAALGQFSQAEADRAFDVIVEGRVNHIDVAASYGDAEDRVRPWLDPGPRDSFSWPPRQASAGRRRPATELERSLERMGVDHVDLWQMHNLVDPIDWDTALSPGGALEAAVAARDEGLVRFIGVTGHGPRWRRRTGGRWSASISTRCSCPTTT